MILQVPQLPFTLIMFVPSAQTQAEVGDAKPISQVTNGFGFLIPYCILRNSTRRMASAVHSEFLKKNYFKNIY